MSNKDHIFDQAQFEKAIDALQIIFRRSPHRFLTEDDLRSTLFAELLKIKSLSNLVKTEDDALSIAIHSEVRWYGEFGGLRYRSDIVILDPTTLLVKNKKFRLPSKGYKFNNFWAIVEVKLRRVNGCSDKEFLNRIKYDIEKLHKIRSETSSNKHDALFMIFCLDKRSDIGPSLENNGDGIEIRYVFAS